MTYSFGGRTLSQYRSDSVDVVTAREVTVSDSDSVDQAVRVASSKMITSSESLAHAKDFGC